MYICGTARVFPQQTRCLLYWLKGGLANDVWMEGRTDGWMNGWDIMGDMKGSGKCTCLAHENFDMPIGHTISAINIV